MKTKEEQQEEKRIALSIRIKSLELDGIKTLIFVKPNIFLSVGLGKEGLKSKADELWENVVRLETEKYDLEMRRERQGYDVSSIRALCDSFIAYLNSFKNFKLDKPSV